MASRYDPDEVYEREPFAVDVSVGKTDQLFQLHSYHTKVPYLAIAPTILHYTKPGDLVLDGFCGSGMTGLACQWCGLAPDDYRLALEQAWRSEGKEKPEWGERYTVLNDLSPAASFIAAGFNIHFESQEFSKEVTRILEEVERETGWMYEVDHPGSQSKGKLNYVVWSEVFACPECSGEVSLLGKEGDYRNCLHGPNSNVITVAPTCLAIVLKGRTSLILTPPPGLSTRVPKGLLYS